jgi:D-glycerate 3-kinase
MDRRRAFYDDAAKVCEGWLAARSRSPFVLGIQGPQGCGKSSLAAALVDAFTKQGKRCVTVSTDDFYLRRDEQVAVAASHPKNRILEHRGAPGTHDVALGARVLGDLWRLDGRGEVRVPAYDKSAFAGRGDRAPESAWRSVRGPLDLVIFEGWTLGFAPLKRGAPEGDLRAVDEALPPYRAWTDMLTGFLMLDTPALETIVRWRIGSEAARRARGEAALSDDDARDYIERFLPVYRAYVPELRERPPCTPSRRIVLAEDRLPARVDEERREG